MPPRVLCTLGGIADYVIYALCLNAGLAPGTAFFAGTAFSALYSEIMARVRKYPTICYLVVSIIPLIPGASLYYTMQQAVDGTMDKFVSQGLFTAEVTGIMAASIILVSSLVRICMGWRALQKGRQKTHD